MLANATITSIATPSGASIAGKMVYPTPTTTSVRCRMSDVTDRHVRELGATIKDATAVLHVFKSDLSGAVMSKGQKLTVLIENDAAAKTWLIVHVRNRQGGLAHFQCFAQEVRS